MNNKDQIFAFESDLNALIDRYRSEFELSLAAAVGVLEVVKLTLWKEQLDSEEE